MSDVNFTCIIQQLKNNEQSTIGTKAPHFLFHYGSLHVKTKPNKLGARKKNYVPVNNPSTTYSLHKSTIYVLEAQRNMMYIIFISSSCRKNSLVSYNGLAVKENVFLNPFAWQCACVCLMEMTK